MYLMVLILTYIIKFIKLLIVYYLQGLETDFTSKGVGKMNTMILPFSA